MMTKSAFPPALIGGLGAAILFLTGFGVFITPLPILFIALSWGIIPSLLSGAICLLAIGAVQGAMTALDAGLFLVVPSLLIAIFALQKDKEGKFYPADRLFFWLMAVSGGSMLAMLVLYAGAAGGLIGTITGFILSHNTLTLLITSLLDETAGSPRILAFIRFTVIILPSIWLLIMVANIIGAQALSQSIRLNIHPTPLYHRFTLPAMWEIILPALIMCSFFLSGSAQDAGFVLTGLFISAYMLLGLATAHVISRTWPLRGFWLGMIYISIVVFLWFALVMAALGMLESRFKLRQKWGEKWSEK